jgi:aarF domain-containing kinase
MKAQRLLSEFQMANPLDVDEQEIVVTVATASNDIQQQQDLSESFWTNGHLMEGVSRGSYVTRWNKGVKVAEPLVKYDPVAAEKLLFRQPAKWLMRNVQIAVPLGLWVGGVLWDIALGTEQKNRINRANQLLGTLTNLGPAIIKAGQALASRPDLLSSEYLEALQKLQDDVPTYSNEVAFATVKQELSLESFNDVFELLEPKPVAAASIGQVYKARLLSNGDVVALKIQRPNCEQIIALDLYVLRWWSGVANAITTFLKRDINVQSIIDDFGEIIYRELDYVAEAANAQRFAELYAAINDVFVPKVYSDLTTSKVLTMEWVDGYRLSDPNLETYGLDRKKLVNILIQCSLRQILENGFFHADPHGS